MSGGSFRCWRAASAFAEQLDPFAWQAERRIERGLIDWYLDLMNRYSPLQDPGTWRSILGAAGDIRGFGPVKMEAITRVKAEVETQLRSLDSA